MIKKSKDKFISLTMNESKYPIPPSHRTFEMGQVTIDSNFDSGNCSHAEKINNSSVK